MDTATRWKRRVRVIWAQSIGPLLTIATILAMGGYLRLPGAAANAGAFVLLPIVYAAFRGGLMSGAASAAIWMTAFAYDESIPGQPFRFDDAQLQRVAVAAVVPLALVLIVHRLKRRSEESARQLAIEQQARVQAETSERRSRFLAESTTLLTSTLDYETVLQKIAALSIPAVADLCLVDLVGDDGQIRSVAAAYVNPAYNHLVHDLREHHAPDAAGESPVAHALRACRSELLTEIPASALDRIVGKSEAHRRIALTLGYRSCIVVPLVARGRTFGAISFISTESQRRYGQEELALAEEVGQRAAIAVDNAMLYRDAREANRLKDEFLATLSHELRTPLNAVLGWIRLLQGGTLDGPTSERALETIERNARMQAQLVADLLDASRIMSGRLRLDPKRVEMAPLVELAIDTARPAAEAKNIAVTYENQADQAAVLGDGDRLQQVVWNLLSNALKFTETGGKVSVRITAGARRVEVAVSDSGVGIAPEFLPYVFDRFRQADGAATRSVGGLGLGLSIVRELVEMHGGTVKAESAGPGKGSTFRVTLPQAA